MLTWLVYLPPLWPALPHLQTGCPGMQGTSKKVNTQITSSMAAGWSWGASLIIMSG